MVQPVAIDPNAVYDDGSLVLTLGLSEGSLVKARREHRLRFTRQGRRTFYLGKWVLDWLSLDSQPEPQEAAHA